MILMLNKLDKNNIKEYKNLVGDNFIIDNNLHSKKTNRNKLVKVAEVIMNNGKIRYIYHTIRTTKYKPGTKEFEGTKNYINIYRQKVDSAM